MLTVVGHRVLVKPIDTKEQIDIPEVLKNSKFQVIRDSDLDRMHEVANQLGTVVGIGPTAWVAYDKYNKAGEPNPEWQPWCKVGDKVLFAQYAGKIVEDPETKEKFMLLNDEDVQLKVE